MVDTGSILYFSKSKGEYEFIIACTCEDDYHMFLSFTNFTLFWLSNRSIFSVPDEGYSRNVPCALNLMSMFLSTVTRRVSHVEQELLTLPEHITSPRFLVWLVLLDL